MDLKKTLGLDDAALIKRMREETLNTPYPDPIKDKDGSKRVAWVLNQLNELVSEFKKKMNREHPDLTQRHFIEVFNNHLALEYVVSKYKNVPIELIINTAHLLLAAKMLEFYEVAERSAMYSRMKKGR